MTVPRYALVTGVLVTTRQPQEHREYRRRGRVASEHDREMSVAPSIALRQGERGHGAEGPCSGGPGGRPHTLSTKDGDVRRVPVPRSRCTAPRRGVRTHGLRRLSALPARPSRCDLPSAEVDTRVSEKYGINVKVRFDRLSGGLPSWRTGRVVTYVNGVLRSHGVPTRGGSVLRNVIHIWNAETPETGQNRGLHGIRSGATSTRVPGRRGVDILKATPARGFKLSTPPRGQRRSPSSLSCLRGVRVAPALDASGRTSGEVEGAGMT